MHRFSTGAAAVAAGVVVSVGVSFAGVAEAGDRLTRREFLEEGNAICADASDELGELIAETGRVTGDDDDELQAFATSVVEILRPAIAELRELEPPKRDEKRVKRILDGYDDAFDQLEEDPEILLEDRDPFMAVDRRASRYGLIECGGG